jgi:hypothetical protein
VRRKSREFHLSSKCGASSADNLLFSSQIAEFSRPHWGSGDLIRVVCGTDTKEDATVRIPAKPTVEKGQNQGRMQCCGCPCVPCRCFLLHLRHWSRVEDRYTRWPPSSCRSPCRLPRIAVRSTNQNILEEKGKGENIHVTLSLSTKLMTAWLQPRELPRKSWDCCLWAQAIICSKI